jgi:arsenical pump membrane protein
MSATGASRQGQAAGTGSAAQDRRSRLLRWLLAGAGAASAAVAAALFPAGAGAAAAQDWPPFVLVAGLLLIGLVADDDQLFATAGYWLGRAARNGFVLFAGAAVITGVVTAVLNLDTSVAFLTPVLVYTARSRGAAGPALVYGCLLLSNAGSLLLPGSNLTNLIVLGHLHLSGGQFAARMWLPWLVSLAVTAAVAGWCERGSLRTAGAEPGPPPRPVLGLGLAAVVAATVAVVLLRNPALPVAGIGAVAAGARLARRREQPRRAAEVLGVPVLAGLFGVAVALGALGRAWSGPARLLAHLGSWATAAFAALMTVVVNNLPAASLLAARRPPHPFSLLVGLNLGPNLCVTGSLAWLLWLRAARAAGGTPDIGRASRIGLIAVPLSMAAALGALALTGSA